MSVVEPNAATSGLVERVKSILLRPGSTWDQIEAEPATTQGLFTGYAAILAAIPAVCGLIGGTVFGVLGIRTPIIAGLVGAVFGYVMSLVMVFVLGLIIDALAPSFDGQKNRVQAMKVAVYASTASWIAGVLQIIPMLGLLAIFGGLYSLYLLYLGLPKLMKTPEEKALGYTAVTIVVAIALSFAVMAVTGLVAGIGAATMSTVGGLASNSVQVGDKSVSLSELEQQSKRIEQAAKAIESGEGVEAIKPDVLKAYLPESAAGFTRTEIKTGSGEAVGVAGSQAEGVYTKGAATIRVAVTDLGAAGALAGLAGAFNMESSTESDGKYEKMGKVDGRLTKEAYDKSSKHGQYDVLVGERVMISVEGDGASMDELKAVAAAVNPDRLERLAKG